MKKFLLLVSILLCLYGQSSAQEPAPTPFPENWQTMVAEQEFSVEVPIELEVSEDKKNKAFLYSGKLNDTYFFILSEKRSEADGTKIGLKYFRNSHASGERVSFGTSDGEKFVLGDDEGFFQRAIYVEVAERVYLFHTVSENNVDETAKRFLRTLKIRGQTSNLTNDLAPTPPVIDSVPKQILPKRQSDTSTGLGVGSGTGQGSGRGSGQGSGNSASSASRGAIKPNMPPANAVGPTQKVKILTKPRALYTNIARVYGLQGNVTLRVLFLGNGNIGHVTVIGKLPLGLTSTAIDAAKSITFEPARKDGVPYTVAMTIQYGFTIY
jgi:hypothetical protein